MTNGNDHPTRGLYGVRATDGGDPTAASEQKTEESQEIFTCPHCRRAFSADYIQDEIARQKEANEKTRTAEEWTEETD